MNLNWARLAKFIAAYGVFFATTGEVIDRLTILELSDASNTIFQWTTLTGLPLVIAIAIQGNLTNLTGSVKAGAWTDTPLRFLVSADVHPQ